MKVDAAFCNYLLHSGAVSRVNKYQDDPNVNA